VQSVPNFRDCRGASFLRHGGFDVARLDGQVARALEKLQHRLDREVFRFGDESPDIFVLYRLTFQRPWPCWCRV
jgi:hypothetical protein